VPDPVDPHHLGQVRGRVRAGGLARAARTGQVGGQVPGGLVRQGARVGGGYHQAGGAVRAPPAQPRVGGPPGLGAPFPNWLRQRIEAIIWTLKHQLGLECHGGRVPAGLWARTIQRLLALHACIWHNWMIGAPVKRSLIAYDHV
jgi:hypothetical protein